MSGKCLFQVTLVLSNRLCDVKMASSFPRRLYLRSVTTRPQFIATWIVSRNPNSSPSCTLYERSNYLITHSTMKTILSFPAETGMP